MSTMPHAKQIRTIAGGGLEATDLQAALAELDSEKVANGFTAPVVYASGIALNSVTKTVTYNNQIYCPTAAALAAAGGTITTTNWVTDSSKFQKIDGVSAQLVASSGSSLVGYTPAGTGAVGTSVQSKLRESVSVKDFGAVGDGVTDDRAAIQAAIDYASSISGVVRVPVGVYIIGDSGLDIASRSYGLLIKSNCEIAGDSPRLCVFKTKVGADIDLVTTARSIASSNVAISNLTLDGNADGTNTDLLGFNAWLSNITNLSLRNVISNFPEAWGLRIQASTSVQLDNITCYHDTATNADGVHFVDCSNVLCTNVEVYTQGDDGFVIEAINSDISDYAVSGLKVTSTSSRGILIFSDPNIVPAARTISNVNITGAVVSDCGSSGVVLQGCSFSNVKVDAVVRDSNDGLYIVPGTTSFPATMRNCNFAILAENLTEYGVITLSAFATYRNNTINATVYNAGNNLPAVSLAGDYWSGSFLVDYNPNGDKTLFSAGVLINSDFNNITVSSVGAGNNLQLATTAQDNNITIGLLSGAVTSDLYISAGATRNNFSNGKIAGAITLSGTTGNLFNNVVGATFCGKKSLNFATLGTGDVVVAHGLRGSPTFVNLTLLSSALAGHIQPIAIDETNITFRGWNAGGTLVTTGSYTICLDARL